MSIAKWARIEPHAQTTDLDVGPDGRAVVLVARAAGDVPPR